MLINDKNGKASCKKNVKDGEKFEELIKAILDLEYGQGHWKKTSKSWDGSRDFEWKEDNYYRWAECKNYEGAISLNVISNTLIMAMVDFADEILLFSYSKIKKPVLEKLIRYADISQKVLRIYADESLETIILKHMSQLKKQFFPEFNLSVPNMDLQPYVSCNIISDPVLAYTVNYDDGNISKKPNEIIFPSTLCLSIFIINWSDKKRTFELEIKWDKCDCCFEILDLNKHGEKTFQLNPNSTMSKKVYFRTTIYKPRLNMPVVSLSCENYSKDFNFGFVKCTWDGECTLQGSTYNKIKTKFSNVINSKFYRAINIYGTSGIGKSRLLRESEDLAIRKDYRVIRFSLIDKNNNTNSFCTFITEFLCALYDMPNFNKFEDSQSTDNLGGIYKLILKINSMDIEEIINKVVPIAVRKLCICKCYITFDNVQFYPELFISFIQNIVESCLVLNKHCKSKMGFSFNIDYIYSQNDCLDFFALLINNKDKIQNRKITGFSSGDETKVFLNQLLEYSDIDDAYINQIIASSQNNPYYLLAYLKSMETNEILKKRADGYFIPVNKYSLFKEKMKEIPKDVSETIEERWRSYIANKDEYKILKIISILHIFQHLDYELIKVFSLSEDTIKELVVCHFLKCKNENYNNYYFEHDLIEKYFSKCFFPLCRYAIEPKVPAYADYWYNKICHIVHQDDMDTAEIKQITNKELPYKIGLEIYTLLIQYLLDKMNKICDLEMYLEIICNICANIREIYGTKEAIILYKKLVNKVETCFPEYQSIIHWAWTIISYANLLYENNCYNEAIDSIKNLLLYWLDSNISNENAIIYCYLYNRLHVYKRALNENVNNDSIYWLEKSEVYENCAETKFLNLIDRGYCFYDNIFSKEKLLLHWKNACNVYETNNLPTKKVNYYYTKIRIHIFCGEYQEAKITIEKGLKAIEAKEEGMYYFTYFTQRYLLCKIALMLLQYKSNENKKIIELFQKVEDLNLILKGRTFYTIYYLKAIFYFMKKKYADSFLCIQSSIDALIESKKLTFQKNYIDQIYENVNYFMCKAIMNNYGEDITGQLSNQKLIKSIKRSLKNSIEKCNQLIISHTPSGLLQSDDHKINFPIL